MEMKEKAVVDNLAENIDAAVRYRGGHGWAHLIVAGKIVFHYFLRQYVMKTLNVS